MKCYPKVVLHNAEANKGLAIELAPLTPISSLNPVETEHSKGVVTGYHSHLLRVLKMGVSAH